MASDQLSQLYEEKNVVYQQMVDHRDKGTDNWDAEDHTKWDELNARMDEITDGIERQELTRNVDQRMDQLAEVDSVKESERKTEIGQARSNRLRVVTREQNALGFHGIMMRALGKPIDSRTEEAMYLQGLGGFSGKVFDINLGVGQTRGFNCFATSGGNKRLWENFNAEYGIQFRAPLNTGTTGAGSEWVPAEEFRAELVKYMIAFGPMRGVVRLIVTSGGEPLRMPTVDDTSQTASIVPEEGAISYVDPTTSEVTWNAYKYGAGVKWSYELQQDSPLSTQSILAELLGERIGRGQSAHFTNGTGTSQPQGITVGASDSGANWLTNPPQPYTNADALIDLQISLDPAYEAGNIAFMFNKKTLGEVRKLKDTQGRYIWQPGLRAGEPDLLLGDNYVINQNMPDATGTNRAFVYGDMSKYIIRDAGTMRSQVLTELYSANDQLGMHVWWRSDGRVQLPPAIKFADVATAGP